MFLLNNSLSGSTVAFFWRSPTLNTDQTQYALLDNSSSNIKSVSCTNFAFFYPRHELISNQLSRNLIKNVKKRRFSPLQADLMQELFWAPFHNRFSQLVAWNHSHRKLSKHKLCCPVQYLFLPLIHQLISASQHLFNGFNTWQRFMQRGLLVKYQQAIYKQRFREILGGGRDLRLWHECLITTLSTQPLQNKRQLPHVELNVE